MQLSANFSFEEFSYREYHVLTPIQTGMLDHLCNSILEPLRKFWGDQPVEVSSGIRFPSDNNALRKKGYHPSETSDHLFGNIIKLRDAKKVKRFGRYYGYSVGAVDIVPSIGMDLAWEMIKPYIDRANCIVDLPQPIGAIRVGQMIFEKWDKKSWIHISNPVSLIYSFPVSRVLTQYRSCFLQSVNGGVSYEPV